MLSVAEAQELVLQHACALLPEKVSLTPDALGLVLAEDIASDLDMPPFDKALMDGYAVRSADLPEGHGLLSVVEEIVAGRTPRLPVRAGQAARIMTGAAVPEGADAVVMVERTRVLEEDKVQIEDRPVQPGQHVLPRGREMRRGQIVLAAGACLRPAEFGLLATVGRTAALLYPRPQVAILATGDEIVEPAQVPEAGQIRNSNGPMLSAQVWRAGAAPCYLGIAQDVAESLGPLVAEGLRSAILILSGGVSAGKRDLVPGILQELGVRPHFHLVEMKPGKPVFFGTRGATLVFGLPGNPVSALVCFELFVRPAVRRLMGHQEPGPRMVEATLTEDFPYQTDRPTYHPARVQVGSQGWIVRPVPWFGSPDLRALNQANALLLLPKGNHRHQQGQSFSVLPFEDQG